MSKVLAADLREALDFRMSEILRFDLFLAVACSVGVGFVAYHHPDLVISVSPWLAGAVGAIIGAVVAGISVQVAFLDQPFLRKLRAINVNPVKYLAPFLFTAVLGTFGLIFLIAASSFTETAPLGAFVPVACVATFLGTWAVFSLIPGLDTLVQFVHLKIEALDVPDNIGQDFTAIRSKANGSR